MKKIFNFLCVLFGTVQLSFMKATTKEHSHLNALDRLLNGMSQDFENGNFEAENFNSHGALNLTNSELAVARKIAPAIVKQVKEGNGGIKVYGQGASPEIVHRLEMQSVGDVNITITRNTANITAGGLPVILPVVLFGSNDYQSEYIGSLTGLVPAGITYSVAKNSTGDVVFTFVRTSDAATDTVTVSNLGNVSMSTFLAGMNNNYFKTCYMKLTIPDDSNISKQFSQPILYGKLSQLGAKNFNQLIPRSRIHSWQYQKFILEVLMPEQKIVPDFQFVMYMTGGEGSFIGLDTFMSERGNLNKEAV